MNDPELQRLFTALRDALRPRLRESEDLRRVVDALADWLKAEAAGATAREAHEPPPPPPPLPTPAPPAPTVAPARTPSTVKRAIVPLKIGDDLVHVDVTGETRDIGRARLAAGASASDDDDLQETRPDRRAAPDLDLNLIAERSRLKAESCRLFIARRAARPGSDDERDLVARMNDMIAKAKATRDCFLWVFWRERAQPDDDALRAIAECYEALADAAQLVAFVDEHPGASRRNDAEDAMFHLAHASAALRCALEETWLTSPDTDQDESHLWLRRETAHRQIFVPRYMSMDDRPDPRDAPEIRADVKHAHNALRERKRAVAQVDERFKRMKYHASRVERDPTDAASHDVARIDESARHLLDLGIAPSDPRFLASLPGAIHDRLRPDASQPLSLVLDAIAQRAVPRAIETPAQPREWSDSVARARRLLAGKRLVILGGIRKPDAEQRIIDAFDLRDLEWVRLNEHTSGAPMNAPIARPDTALVVILIRFIGHLHAEEARIAATSAGKPFIHLPAGYSPEQIADAVLQQASKALSQRDDDAP
jgi:hypothetical protein